MRVEQTVLLLGGTGRTGRLVLEQFLSRGVSVRAIVRSAGRLPPDVGADNPFFQWASLRPDTLVEGTVSEYALHEGLVSSLFKPDSTNMANVAHSICELATDQKLWDHWKEKLPVIVNTSA